MDAESAPAVAELARHCEKAMARYRLQLFHDSQPCHELFRLALVMEDQAAWTAIYEQYDGLVRNRLRDAPGDTDALVNRAFERFWRALPPERFSDFRTLGELLSYLTLCAQCVRIDAFRQEAHLARRQVPLSDVPELPAEPRPSSPGEWIPERMAVLEAFEYALELLHNREERLVFRATCEWDMKPRLIAERWPNDFVDGRQVCRIKERIYRRLRRNQELRRFFGNG